MSRKPGEPSKYERPCSLTRAEHLRAQQERDAALRQRVVNAQRLALCADLGIEPSHSWGNIVEAWQKLEADNAALQQRLAASEARLTGALSYAIDKEHQLAELKAQIASAEVKARLEVIAKIDGMLDSGGWEFVDKQEYENYKADLEKQKAEEKA